MDYKVTVNGQVLQGAFSDEHSEIIKLFIECATNLSNADFFLNGNPATSMRLDDNGISTNGMPTDSQMNDILMRIRPFVLMSEDTYISNFVNMLCRHYFAQGTEGNKYLTSLKDEFLKPSISIPFAIKSNGANLFVDKSTKNEIMAFDIWINGFIYHRDLDKRCVFEKIFGTKSPDPFSIWALFQIIMARKRVICKIASFIDGSTRIQSANL